MRKRFFSLIELLITFCLLSAVGSALGIWVYKKIEKSRFYNECARLEKALAVCQKMAKIRQMDTSCILLNTSNGIKYEMKELHLPIDKNCILHAHFEIDQKKIEKITIEYTPTGNVDPKCKIFFLHKNKKFTKEILL